MSKATAPIEPTISPRPPPGSRPDRFGDRPFPLQRYILIYGGLLAILFYVLLFVLLVLVTRRMLWQQYVRSARQKATYVHEDIVRDFLAPRGLTLATLDPGNEEQRLGLRHEIAEIMRDASGLAKLKLLKVDGTVLYDHTDPAAEGELYDDIHEDGFQTALRGEDTFAVEPEADGEKLMEIYLPIMSPKTGRVEGVFEMYERTVGFDAFMRKAMFRVLGMPTVVFAVFIGVLFLLVRKADRVIAAQHNLLRKIRDNMAKYLPDAAVTAIWEAGGDERHLLRGERDRLTVLFTDVRGFTRYSEQATPETVVRQLNRLFDLQARVIYQHHGWIDKFVGDEVMALFRNPNEAVGAAAEVIRLLHREGGLDLEIGAGINVGDMVMGNLGTSERRDFTVIGDTVNTGARLCAQAEPGEVLISPAIYEAISDEWRRHFVNRRELRLKGKRDPLVVHSLNALTMEPDDHPATPAEVPPLPSEN